MSAARVLDVRHVEQSLDRTVLALTAMKPEEHDVGVLDFFHRCQVRKERSLREFRQRRLRRRLGADFSGGELALFSIADHAARRIESDDFMPALTQSLHYADS